MKIDWNNLSEEEKDWIFIRGTVIDYLKYLLNKTDIEYFGEELPKMYDEKCKIALDKFITDNNIILQPNKNLYRTISEIVFDYTSNKITKLICINELIWETQMGGKTCFYKNNIYNMNLMGFITDGDSSGSISLSKEILPKYFITLSEYRDIRINNILEE